MTHGAGYLADGEMAYNDSSRTDPKRPNQWLLDSTDVGLFPSKKQAVESTANRPISGVPNVNLSWENPSSFQSVSGPFTDRLFGSEITRTINFGGGRSFQSINAGHLDMGRRDDVEQFGNDASVALSMSHTIGAPSGSYLSYGGIRKVKVNQVKDSESHISLPMGQNFNKSDNNTISFNGFQEEPATNPSGRLISHYDLLMGQSSIQISEPSNEKEIIDPDEPIITPTPLATSVDRAVKTKTVPKIAKKSSPNNFPSNVRSLLSTGILDGIHVKYVGWSREELDGVIKGPGFLCGCQLCNYTKVLNAYEFEKHAQSKTKHPNNHIFFDNGKTIYAVVQELKNTPEDFLFEAIETATGSGVNEKIFKIWKGDASLFILASFFKHYL
ncbi:hypothetical protein GIB67_015052 [Kingdonia uniflora]|uniref:Tify domain-containing protein n=1 Tax=Kingdonia uniflora TaxID=39325 RepID=A0A7J7NMU0_9MAGN|nr:hypothetical protein GIB67_015052 [Kingdonia uniflora]